MVKARETPLLLNAKVCVRLHVLPCAVWIPPPNPTKAFNGLPPCAVSTPPSSPHSPFPHPPIHRHMHATSHSLTQACTHPRPPTSQPAQVGLSLSQRPATPSVSNMTKQQFLDAVAATKEYIQVRLDARGIFFLLCPFFASVVGRAARVPAWRTHASTCSSCAAPRCTGRRARWSSCTITAPVCVLCCAALRRRATSSSWCSASGLSGAPLPTPSKSTGAYYDASCPCWRQLVVHVWGAGGGGGKGGLGDLKWCPALGG